MQLGNIVYQGFAASLGPNAANNGLSVSGGIVQLGAVLGTPGPGKLLNDREIYFNNFNLRFSGLDDTFGNNITFQTASNTGVNPQFTFRNQIGTDIGRIRFDAQANSSMYMGKGAGIVSTGPNNTFIGADTGSQLTTGQRNTLIGIGAGQGNGAVNFNNNVVIGLDSLDNGGAATGDFSVIIGNNNLDFGFAVGNNVLVLGAANNNSIGSAVGNAVICLGFNIGLGGGLTNTTIICPAGTGAATLSLSNVFVLGINTQNILIGQTPGAFADNGNRVQITGKLNTGGVAPLTLGAGNMDFGKIVTAASVLNATKYWEVSVDGVLVKVCIN